MFSVRQTEKQIDCRHIVELKKPLNEYQMKQKGLMVRVIESLYNFFLAAYRKKRRCFTLKHI